MTVRQAYSEAVESGKLARDPEQVAVLPVLEGIREFLNGGQANGGLRRIFSKAAVAPKGLYLWGGVGRGKSMLMDLFVGCVAAPKRRVHFHGFMQEVHAALHAARKTQVEDALRPVAKAISDDVRLLALDEMQINDRASPFASGHTRC